MENKYVLQMINISKTFPGVKALDQVNLNVRRGTVHSLMGENGAGKSTLMKCLFGIYSLDNGEIILDGERVSFASPSEALYNHVAMVHQELNQVLARNVMENIWLGRYPTKNGVVDEKKMYKDTKGILDELEIDVNPRAKMETLTVPVRQMIEIAKAISYKAKVIVMDEPTSSLMENEVEHLFRIISKVKKSGSSIIYISHRMEEILRISDDVTVLRDGQHIATKMANELDTDNIIKMMVGRELKERYPGRDVTTGEVVLEVEDIDLVQPMFADIEFKVRKGEIFGIAGLVGSKRTELLEAIFGMRKISKGVLKLNGKEINNDTPVHAIKNGFAMVTEERRTDGIFADLPITFNMIIADLNNYLDKGILRNKKINNAVSEMAKSLNIKMPSVKTRIGNLSGGNQQKVILGRWMLTKPQIFLFDEPTRGIDVGAKYEIYQLMNRLVAEGKSIIMISSEMPELLGICDRILVMSNGHQAGMFDVREEVTQEQIMKASAMFV